MANYANQRNITCLIEKSSTTMPVVYLMPNMTKLTPTKLLSNKQLDMNKHHNLQQILAKYNKVFDDPFGVSPHQKVHFEILPG